MTTQQNTVPFTKTAPPEWLLAFWKEIDDKTFGKGFDCFAENAACNFGVAGWLLLLGSSGLMVTIPRKTLSGPPSQYSTTS